MRRKPRLEAEYMWSTIALKYILRTRLGRRKPHSLESVADKSWTIAPGETTVSPPAFYLPQQARASDGLGLRE